MSISGMAAGIADRVLDKIAPKATAKADQFECTWEYRCYLPYCGGSSFRLTRQRRQVCAGHSAPSYGPWERVTCC